jgi:hypothetical protein
MPETETKQTTAPAAPASTADAPSAKTSTSAGDSQQKALKAALLKSVSDFIPREMGRKVSVGAGHLRRTFGDEGAKALGVTEQHGPNSLVCVTVEAIYAATKDA